MNTSSARPVHAKVAAGPFSLLLVVVFLAGVGIQPAAAVSDFSFVHISDEHVFHSGTEETIAELATLGPVPLKPYGVTAPAPSFVISTGDLTEFGPKGGAWETVSRFYGAVKIPKYMTVGNHDETWRSLSYEMRQLYGKPCYSWDAHGCHFVILKTAGLQDPRPVLAPEELAWLKGDLKAVGPDTPVFIAFHHPLTTTEFSSPYEVDRLIDILRPYNVAAILVGHSHGIVRDVYEGLDMIHGGSAWGPRPPGYMVFCVQGGVLRVAYKERGNPEATQAMLEKPIAAPGARNPVVAVESPVYRETLRGTVRITARVNPADLEVKTAVAEIDGAEKLELAMRPNGVFEGLFDAAALLPGAHYVRVKLTLGNDWVIRGSTSFYTEGGGVRPVWRVDMGAASKSTPAVTRTTVYVGTNEGRLLAYDRATGALKWQSNTGGAIVCEPLVLGDRLYFGSEDRFFRCLSAQNGKLIWRFAADDPIYSSPVSDGSAIYFGCGTGAFYSLDAATGHLNWVNRDATYNIESQPFLAGARVYYGAWDNYLYCVNTADGSLAWKCMGQGSAEGAAPHYYSPADCGPVVAGGKAIVADRKYRLSLIDAEVGKIGSFLDKVSAVSLSGDGKHVYLRSSAGKTLIKADLEGNTVWSVECAMDEAPPAPREVDGVVYVSSKRGLVSAVSAHDGKVLWQYQATPSSYVLSSVSAADGVAYVSGTDGSLTAITARD